MKLGMAIFEQKTTSFEATTISDIMRTFRGKNMVVQYFVDGYFIDLYFPKYKLAIECDERRHTFGHNAENDRIRQSRIQSSLGFVCAFVRYAPYAKDFSIFDVINEINCHINP